MASSFVGRSGAKPPSSPTAVDSLRSCRTFFKHVVGLGAPAQRLAEARRADRHDHELLEVDGVVGVHAAVDDVHHRHRQDVGVGAADVAVQRDRQVVGGRLGDGQADAEDGVGAEASLVVGAVELEHREVDRPLLVARRAPTQLVGDLVVDELRPPWRTPLPPIAVAAVAQLDRLVLAGGRTRRDGGAAAGPAVQDHLDLDGRVAPGIEDLATDNVHDLAHRRVPPSAVAVGASATRQRR